MKRRVLQFMAVVSVLVAFSVSSATTHYVDANGANPVSPFTSWATAATNLQDAASHSGFGDTILVTNGVYQYGGDSFSGSNRVDVSGATLQSVNGPAVTIIKGYQVPGTTNGTSAVRCVFLREFSILSGFTLTNGATQSSGNGGGVVAESSCIVGNCVITRNVADGNGGGSYSGNNSLVADCIITGNTLTYGGGDGGGVFGCTLNNCVVSGNNATHGGGVYNCTANNCLFTGNGNTNVTDGGAADFSTLNNCTLAGNFSHILGAAEGCTFNNSIIYYNNNGEYADCYQCRLTNSCTPLGNGTPALSNNSITNAPMFVNLAGDFHLQPWSPCIDAGTNVFSPVGTDLAGNPRLAGAAMDMGCYENQNTNPVHYVSLSSTAPVAPFTNWMTAATNIQDAVNAAGAGDFVVVSNGVYNYGANYVYLEMPNRVVVNQRITVVSLNGPTATMIQGTAIPIQMRCVYLTNGATLSGFTLTNGRTMNSGDPIHYQSGGGVWCEGGGAVVSNCVITGNSAIRFGGGIFQGTLLNCVLTNNSGAFGGGACSNTAINCLLTHNTTGQQNLDYGGGASGSWLSNCLITANQAVAGSGYGGGAAFSTLTACVVSNNTAGGGGGGLYFAEAHDSLISSNRSFSSGGGAFSNLLDNCVLKNNVANGNGGGAYNSILLDCTVVSNLVSFAPGSVGGGGVCGGSASNCIIYYNSCSGGGGTNFQGSAMSYSDTTPSPANGFGNITNAPLFVNLAGEDFHLQTNSPCINGGNNSVVTSSMDFDDNPRIVGGTVDIGAYEFQSPASTISYAYLQQYGLPTDGSADNLDSDGDGVSNYAEWRAGTNPNDAASLLKMSSAAPTNNSSGATITWQSVSGVNYFVQRGSDLNAQPVFSTIQSNIVGQAGTTSFTDTMATNNLPYFYRVGVQ